VRPDAITALERQINAHRRALDALALKLTSFARKLFKNERQLAALKRAVGLTNDKPPKGPSSCRSGPISQRRRRRAQTHA
jgi:hypothetical protein